MTMEDVRPVNHSHQLLALAARGESLAAFDERCIPAGGVAPPSNTPGILSRRALPAGRLARLGATPDFHHGLLGPSRGWHNARSQPLGSLSPFTTQSQIQSSLLQMVT